MAPDIRDGARIEVRPQRLYWPGDIVVFRTVRGPLAVHRLIGVYFKGGEARFVTMPDNRARPDSALPWVRILGRVTGGDCSESVGDIPLRTRLRCAGRFLLWVSQGLARRR